MARSALQRKTAMPMDQFSQAVASLLETGVIFEERVPSKVGRPATLYRVAPTPPINAGLDRLDPERAPGHPEMVPVPPPRGEVE
jgi:hypothetical protein